MADNLKEKIRNEMTAVKTSVLDNNLDIAKEFFTLAEDGTVSLKDCSKLSNVDKIVLYLIGKLYAKQAEYSTEDIVSNKELEKELGLPDGSVKSSLKTLRDARVIRQIAEGVHTIAPNKVSDVLNKVKIKIEAKKNAKRN